MNDIGTEDKELKALLQELVDSNRKLLKGPSLWRSFLVGAVGAIGATVGAAIIITLLASLLGALAGINLFRPFAQSVLPYVQKVQTGPTPETSPFILPAPTYETPSPSQSASALATPLATPSQ